MSALTDHTGPVIPVPAGGGDGQVSAPQNMQQTRPRRTARRMIGAALALVVVLVVTWICLGLNPSVGPGNESADPVGPMRVATDGISPTRWVLDGNAGGDGTLRLSIRNDGLARITVLGVGGADSASSAATGWWGAAKFLFLGPLSDIGYDLPGSPTVQLEPGQQALVAVTVHVPACALHVAGTRFSVTTLPLKVRSLGLTTEQDVVLPLELTILFTHTHTPGANCP